MTPPTAFGFEQLITEMLRGLVDTVADRPGETDAQRFARHQTAVFSTMAFLPRDAVETMLACQCVMFDHLLRDGTRDLLRGQSEQIKLRVRPQLTAIGRLFLQHLVHLRKLQVRPVEQIAVVPVANPDAAVPRSARAMPGGERPPAAPPGRPEVADASAPAPVAEEQSAAVGSPLPTAEVEPASDPAQAPRTDKAARLLRRGFQNRRLRRSIQFKSPAGNSAQRP